MQPYFFPYLGYFSLIKHTDQFILFDPVQFIRHGWIERNRILHPDKGWQYIKVPLIKHSKTTTIKDIIINDSIDWKRKIFSQLGHYKKKAPFFKQTMQVVKKSLEIETPSITKLNQNILKNVCNYLDIEKDFLIFSEMHLGIDAPKAPDEWALNICKSLENIKQYWNPPGGKSFFDETKYKTAGIKLVFHAVELSKYNQLRENFESGLSIIDVMMYNSVEKINEMLDIIITT